MVGTKITMIYTFILLFICSLISVHSFSFTFFVRLKAISDLYLRATSLYSKYKFQHGGSLGLSLRV